MPSAIGSTEARCSPPRSPSAAMTCIRIPTCRWQCSSVGALAASYLIDSRDGRLLQVLASPPNRHFYGHGVFHRDGEWFYTTENDTRDAGRGVLGVYRLQGRAGARRRARNPWHRPHQLLWMPDHETLVIANGGIRTGPTAAR